MSVLRAAGQVPAPLAAAGGVYFLFIAGMAATGISGGSTDPKANPGREEFVDATIGWGTAGVGALVFAAGQTERMAAAPALARNGVRALGVAGIVGGLGSYVASRWFDLF